MHSHDNLPQKYFGVIHVKVMLKESGALISVPRFLMLTRE